MGGEDEKRNRGLADQDHHLPVLAAAESVTAVQEPSGLVDPAGCIGEALSGRPERPDEEDQQADVHEQHEGENQDNQRQVVSSEALQTGVHDPVADLLDVLRRGHDVVDADAESHAESRLDHCHRADVPENHDRQQQSLRQVSDWPLYAVEERNGRPEEREQQEGDAWNDADDNDECRRRRVQEAVFGAQTHNRTSNAL